MKPAAGAMGTSTTAAANHMATAGGGSFWHEILGAFSPNRVISKEALRFIIAFQIAVLLVATATSTFVFLPNPTAVRRACVDLWTPPGLGPAAIARFPLTAQALAGAFAIA